MHQQSDDVSTVNLCWPDLTQVSPDLLDEHEIKNAFPLTPVLPQPRPLTLMRQKKRHIKDHASGSSENGAIVRALAPTTNCQSLSTPDYVTSSRAPADRSALDAGMHTSFTTSTKSTPRPRKRVTAKFAGGTTGLTHVSLRNIHALMQPAVGAAPILTTGDVSSAMLKRNSHMATRRDATFRTKKSRQMNTVGRKNSTSECKCTDESGSSSDMPHSLVSSQICSLSSSCTPFSQQLFPLLRQVQRVCSQFTATRMVVFVEDWNDFRAFSKFVVVVPKIDPTKERKEDDGNDETLMSSFETTPPDVDAVVKEIQQGPESINEWTPSALRETVYCCAWTKRHALQVIGLNDIYSENLSLFQELVHFTHWVNGH